MSLYQIVLRLARNPGFPEGDDSQGYVLVAPLDRDDRLDASEWREMRDACTVVRFKPGEEKDADGRLTHNGSSWFFHYDEAREGADEPVYRLGDHRLAIGDYVTIHENDGQSLTYKVAQRTPFHAQKGRSSDTQKGAR
ncbi:MAG: hypothetical protein EON61_00510 [Alphaproteobacteria bacterium]|nr:MAG: hypothetical protein EON61_00510 [Alphaproteobacteria bacterium]